MSNAQMCPKCGAELPADAPAGLCPKCLVAAGFESQSGIQAEKPRSDPKAPTQASPGPAFTPPEVAEIADKFPHLEILGLLGHGGMGAVYKARQKNLDRLVALKIIRPEATHDAAFAERFNREAKTLARLGHQHIVAVHDFGEVEYSEVEGQPARPLYYFLMEFVDGANLRQLMQAEELLPEQALAIIPQICDALQYAHDEGVVHRDIKPENILLDKRGRVKIADFGLAKLALQSEAEFTLTGTHQVMGTLRYMAPEQMEGSHAVDHRADIYSLGVVFYEMLTGEVPAGYFEPPSKKVEVDVRLDEVVLRSLAREPERRYQQASDVKTDVESISNSALKSMRPIERTLDVQDGVSGPRQFSRKAIAGGVLTVLFFTLTVPALFGVGAARSAGSADVGIIVGIIAALILLFCVISGPVSCLLGVVAISDIRHSQGRITGLGLAFFDAVFFPLLLLDSVIVVLGLWIHARLSSPDEFSPWIAIVIGLTILVVDALILLPAWRATASSIHRNKGGDASDSVDDVTQKERSTTSRLASDIAQDADERQREAELAEIAPDWLCYPFMGLFAAGWILVGLLWNLRWPGLWVAIGVMAAITYYVVQWTLRYLPKLRKELEREPRWSRGTTLAVALVLFTLGMLSVIGFQATLGDIFSEMQMFGGPSDIWTMSEEEQRASIALAKLDGLQDAEILSAGFSGSFLIVELMLKGLWAPLFLLSSIASLIHTRRYRYTWKHWWRPSLSVTVYSLGMLLIVHFLHVMIVGYSEGGVEAREIRCAAPWDDLQGALSSWQTRNGYAEKGFSHRWLKKESAEVGAMYGRHLMARSRFDGYQASWQHIVLRPRPPLYLTAVTQKEPAQTYVRVQFPHKTKGSPEEAWWTELVDDLEETLVNAAAQEDKPEASDTGAMRSPPTATAQEDLPDVANWGSLKLGMK